MNLMHRCLLFIGAAVLSLTAVAHEYQAGELMLDHPWTRATAPGAPVGGGFLVISNQGDTDDVLTGGDADFASKVTLHESTMADGMMSMRPLNDGLTIPAGDSVTLKPGGYHLMFEGLSSPLVEGERVPVILHFQNAGSVTVEFHIDEAGKKGHDHH